VGVNILYREYRRAQDCLYYDITPPKVVGYTGIDILNRTITIPLFDKKQCHKEKNIIMYKFNFLKQQKIPSQL